MNICIVGENNHGRSLSYGRVFNANDNNLKGNSSTFGHLEFDVQGSMCYWFSSVNKYTHMPNRSMLVMCPAF